MSSYHKLLHASLLDALVSIYGATRFREVHRRFAELCADWGPKSTIIAEEIRLREMDVLAQLLHAQERGLTDRR